MILRCLGPRWALFRLVYAARMKSGYFKRRFRQTDWPPSSSLAVRVPAFNGPGSQQAVEEADRLLAGTFRFFSRHEVEVGFPPDWFRNPFWDGGRGSPVPRFDTVHWSEISETACGDIKGVWELSRFGFVYTLARAHRHTRDEKYAEAFWRLVEDWRSRNPPNTGVHWRCGQEITFRIMAWCFGAGAFGASPSATPLRRTMLAGMIAASAERIEGNLDYALSQKNNHGISEAVGLWTAGLILPAHGRAEKWETKGRRHLERLAMDLIYPDGTFAQHSLNYHRLMLQDYLWAIRLGRANAREFSPALLGRVGRAGDFLEAVMDPATGFVPNMGSNDGALILPLTDCDYRDFRPTAQAVSLVTRGRSALPPGPWDHLAIWMGVGAAVEERVGAGADGGRKDADTHCRDFADGGCVVLKGAGTAGVIRCTGRYRHRPAHADQLHLDLWKGGANVLRDSGSYSYSCEEPWQWYFRSTAAHNNVEFDGRDQMPRLSRFLYGSWVGVQDRRMDRSGEEVCWSGWYEDYRGCRHEREVRLRRASDVWVVTDRVSGYRDRAVLRWRLAPDFEWELNGGTCRSALGAVSVAAEPSAAATALNWGWESLYYFERCRLPVLEVTLVPPAATCTSTLAFGS